MSADMVAMALGRNTGLAGDHAVQVSVYRNVADNLNRETWDDQQRHPALSAELQGSAWQRWSDISAKAVPYCWW